MDEEKSVDGTVCFVESTCEHSDQFFFFSDASVETTVDFLVKKWQIRLKLYRKFNFVCIQAELQGPGGIESRGYFLYRVCKYCM